MLDLEFDPPNKALIVKQVIALCLAHTRRLLELFQAYRAAYLFIVPFDGSILLQVKLHLKFLHLPLHF